MRAKVANRGPTHELLTGVETGAFLVSDSETKTGSVLHTKVYQTFICYFPEKVHISSVPSKVQNRC